jgi:hypothetical protein
MAGGHPEEPMTPFRLAAVVLVFVVAALAWVALGTSVVARTGEFDDRLSKEVALLWGGPHTQIAPDVRMEQPKTVTERVQRTDAAGRTVSEDVTRVVIETVPVALASSRVDVGLSLEHRRKGLLWYDTYGVRLNATYRARNAAEVPRIVVAHLKYPSEHVQFDNFVLRINWQDAARIDDLSEGATARVEVPAGGEIVVELGYNSRGLDTWTYAFASAAVTEVKDFVLTMRTDFDQVDFPPGTMSPSASRRVDAGWELIWQFDSLLTGRQIGMDLPNRQNPGPLTARITYFAPVSLLFFLTVMVILGVLSSEGLHPMHYAFLSAAFFAFHLLLAYLVDHLPLAGSFVIASATSVFLVMSYLHGVAVARRVVVRAGLAQFLFLVLFSAAFFAEGYTGLTVTIGAVVTLFVLMQATARVDWASALAGGTARAERQS